MVKRRRPETWFGKPFKIKNEWFVNYNIKDPKTGFIDVYLYKSLGILDD